MTPRIMFYVQHLMGVGHVFRAARVSRALAAAGYDVHLVAGGPPVPYADPGGATTHALPPLSAASSDLGRLLTPDGSEADAGYLDHRRAILLDLFRRLEPAVLITEAFPFGRRQMRFELLPLLDAAKSAAFAPKILASVRDILQENRKPGRDLETLGLVETYYDDVLVHADPRLVRLDATFPHGDRIAGKLLYTGIVASDVAVPSSKPSGSHEVVVSVGGGVLGRELLFAAPKAKELSVLKDARWCIVTGINTAGEDVARLRAMASGDVEFAEFLPDLRDALSGCRLSISRAGYNTVADILRAGCRSVVVPLADGNETEQLRRTRILSQAGLVETVEEGDHGPEALAAAIDRVMARPAPGSGRVDLDGARRSAEIISAMLSGASLDSYR